jgi:hypothetical protein
MAIANDLESFGDVIQDNILHCAEKRLRLHINISPITIHTLQPVYKKVYESYSNMLKALERKEIAAAEKAVNNKAALAKLAEEAANHLTKRLVASEPNRVAAFKIESDLIEHFLRLNTISRKIARRLIE